MVEDVSDLQHTLCREALRRRESRANSICVWKTDDKLPYILYPEETEGFAV
jgi:hypothetical protein